MALEAATDQDSEAVLDQDLDSGKSPFLCELERLHFPLFVEQQAHGERRRTKKTDLFRSFLCGIKLRTGIGQANEKTDFVLRSMQKWSSIFINMKANKKSRDFITT
ncbi:hypothetical protein BCV53_09580 [Parageobacillus thermoglucosidasius]|uniref:Uncharacterized protein n=1 Tax=Parageobacillus thermoglucosidasius TaxID=1426 RepID=A0AAN1D6T6_PARTM|nr:hypothetical protein AOT13_09570 [Parageobacillus thermoglucosidasius]GAJ41974.1 hypothetical protein GT2_01_01130 [Parageobacillus thermoglucosidasius NBRC 107763]ANZ30327.1 hypothetical protein BCV53_09580 [Parageobacillus thermoglucosidasius]APM81065.1 hypothetical protein BCV54_09585 [Parageobacillus thermoglucosidasius]KJX70779.1 hypothetical protein WH82_01270 [Parageobacillus thermoglucosidasius]